MKTPTISMCGAIALFVTGAAIPAYGQRLATENMNENGGPASPRINPYRAQMLREMNKKEAAEKNWLTDSVRNREKLQQDALEKAQKSEKANTDPTDGNNDRSYVPVDLNQSGTAWNMNNRPVRKQDKDAKSSSGLSSLGTLGRDPFTTGQKSNTRVTLPATDPFKDPFKIDNTASMPVINPPGMAPAPPASPISLTPRPETSVASTIGSDTKLLLQPKRPPSASQPGTSLMEMEARATLPVPALAVEQIRREPVATPKMITPHSRVADPMDFH